ncbi:MAG: PQQ-like beta-propeller repeat protein, partial [Candidatus Latescibacterota bacterium]
MFSHEVLRVVLIMLLLSLFASAFAGSAHAQEDWWPMYLHDPAHSGHSSSRAPTTNDTVWTFSTGGNVQSSCAVVDGRVYFGSHDNNVYCLDASTGAPLWNYTTGSYVISSPAVYGGRVYVGSKDDKVYCLNATTGAFIWSYTTGYDV